ncbi:MAG: RrF2 family transcriptional regulator [bacterium]
MLSNTCKYAVRAVIYLAYNEDKGKNIGIKQISEDLEIPMPFLGKILQILAKQKLLISTKGPNGGFKLANDAHKINLLDIVRVIDGKDLFEDCLIGLKTCNEEDKPCPIHSKYAAIRSDLYNMFQKQSIGGLVEELKKGNLELNL